MQQNGTSVCLPEMTAEAARLRILQFIEATTGGNPSSNKDGGDWGRRCRKYLQTFFAGALSASVAFNFMNWATALWSSYLHR
jgi:hypothetical protein